MIWHDIRDPQDPELDELARKYNLHPLHIEDCRHRNQSAKVEEQDGYLFVVLKPMRMEKTCELEIIDFDVFLGADWVITVQEANCPEIQQSLDRAGMLKEKLRSDELLYRILDAIVDSYLPILDKTNDVIDDTEDKVLESPDPAMLQQIFNLKRVLIEMRRVAANMRDVVGHLQRIEHNNLIAQDLGPFLRDVYDHVARNLDMIETQRDLVNGSLDIYLSSVANRTNQVMKVLTVLGTIALPALVISGFYGMNVKGLPFSDTPHAIWMVTVLIFACSAGLIAMLRRFGWF